MQDFVRCARSKGENSPKGKGARWLAWTGGELAESNIKVHKGKTAVTTE